MEGALSELREPAISGASTITAVAAVADNVRASLCGAASLQVAVTRVKLRSWPALTC